MSPHPDEASSAQVSTALLRFHARKERGAVGWNESLVTAAARARGLMLHSWNYRRYFPLQSFSRVLLVYRKVKKVPSSSRCAIAVVLITAVSNFLLSISESGRIEVRLDRKRSPAPAGKTCLPEVATLPAEK